MRFTINGGQRMYCRETVISEISKIWTTQDHYYIQILSERKSGILDHYIKLLDMTWPAHPEMVLVNQYLIEVGPIPHNTDRAMIHAMLGIIRAPFFSAGWYWGNDLVALKVLNTMNPDAVDSDTNHTGAASFLLSFVPATTLLETCTREAEFLLNTKTAFDVCQTLPAYKLMLIRPGIPTPEELVPGIDRRGWWVNSNVSPGMSWNQLVSFARRFIPWGSGSIQVDRVGFVHVSSLLAFHLLKMEVSA